MAVVLPNPLEASSTDSEPVLPYGSAAAGSDTVFGPFRIDTPWRPAADRQARTDPARAS